jgi:hypothetical protein
MTIFFVVFAFMAVFVSYCPLFWGSVEIYMKYDSLYILERNDEKLSFLRLWPFLWTIAHCFGVSGWSTRPMKLSACLRGMTKNSSFLHFRAVFMSYRPLFRGYVEIYKEYDSLYILERNDHFFLFLRLWQFSWAIAHSFGVLSWFIRPMTLSTCLRGVTKNSSFLCFRAVFMRYCPQFWGFGVIYKIHDTKYMFERHGQNLVVFGF